MAKYIKANPKVARYLKVTRTRNVLPDGNYLLWQADMLAFGTLLELPQTLVRIGGLALTPDEARREQDGKECRTLPQATDKAFRTGKAVAKEEDSGTADDGASIVEVTDNEGEEMS